jgi:hypothetical protein
MPRIGLTHLIGLSAVEVLRATGLPDPVAEVLSAGVLRGWFPLRSGPHRSGPKALDGRGPRAVLRWEVAEDTSTYVTAIQDCDSPFKRSERAQRRMPKASPGGQLLLLPRDSPGCWTR